MEGGLHVRTGLNIQDQQFNVGSSVDLAESPNTITQNNERGDNKHFNVNDLIKEKGIER